MSAVQLDQANFKQLVEREGITFIDWWAPWCGPCRAFAPIYEGAADRHPDIVFGKVNTDDEPALAGAFEISAIPTLMVFRDGYPIFMHPGLLPAAALDELIGKVRALDMDEVKKAYEQGERA